jgi:hypothetical protein
MMQSKSPYDKYGYIKDGKIYHLDGIDKGDTINAWTDLVGKNVINNDGAIELIDGWQLSNGNGLKGEYTYFPGSNNYTVEVCIIPTTSKYFVIIFDFGGINSPSVPLFHNNNKVITFLQNGNTYTLPSHTNDSPHCISLNLDCGCHNGISLTKNSGTDYWGNDHYTRIGRRGNYNSDFFNGKIHAVRIYNRRLTLSEMLNNQKVDNARFNLGLTL